MRELKFRAWNVSEKCWAKEFYPLFNGYDEGRGGHWMEGVQGDNDEDLMVSNKEVVICQYTGLKDRKGKEIYEGDVIAGMGFIEWIPKDARFGFNISGEMKEVEFYELTSKDISIIGNIYENPELLKG